MKGLLIIGFTLDRIGNEKVRCFRQSCDNHGYDYRDDIWSTF
jgi:hypothetical protein